MSVIQLDNSENGKHRLESRIRTVSSRYYDFESGCPHPYIRIGGKYLETYGFRIGDRFELQLDHRRIIILRVPNELSETGD